ncbi:hypothetical protein SODALDRAFT_363070 [Sodiomyces alkalinus F11]|uniref:Uncharacterized protein n=1 Tax=Sodiomyces alkalinus (strain CBS 110278 / VKM F-3762 / F11) TaxID=1314773 RepID=A0A3N2PL68_SODAK|nr:hypothetical protein SODALDRAFT_363070 [Sodiomyces alkalinus F11]ROT35262.1 hypothetical protein SODALDRAFT_363070 [Sodiomyces alkalinus F11]
MTLHAVDRQKPSHTGQEKNQNRFFSRRLVKPHYGQVPSADDSVAAVASPSHLRQRPPALNKINHKHHTMKFTIIRTSPAMPLSKSSELICFAIEMAGRTRPQLTLLRFHLTLRVPLRVPPAGATSLLARPSTRSSLLPLRGTSKANFGRSSLHVVLAGARRQQSGQQSTRNVLEDGESSSNFPLDGLDICPDPPATKYSLAQPTHDILVKSPDRIDILTSRPAFLSRHHYQRNLDQIQPNVLPIFPITPLPHSIISSSPRPAEWPDCAPTKCLSIMVYWVKTDHQSWDRQWQSSKAGKFFSALQGQQLKRSPFIVGKLSHPANTTRLPRGPKMKTTAALVLTAVAGVLAAPAPAPELLELTKSVPQRAQTVNPAFAPSKRDAQYHGHGSSCHSRHCHQSYSHSYSYSYHDWYNWCHSHCWHKKNKRDAEPGAQVPSAPQPALGKPHLTDPEKRDPSGGGHHGHSYDYKYSYDWYYNYYWSHHGDKKHHHKRAEEADAAVAQQAQQAEEAQQAQQAQEAEPAQLADQSFTAAELEQLNQMAEQAEQAQQADAQWWGWRYRNPWWRYPPGRYPPGRRPPWGRAGRNPAAAGAAVNKRQEAPESAEPIESEADDATESTEPMEPNEADDDTEYTEAIDSADLAESTEPNPATTEADDEALANELATAELAESNEMARLAQIAQTAEADGAARWWRYRHRYPWWRFRQPWRGTRGRPWRGGREAKRSEEPDKERRSCWGGWCSSSSYSSYSYKDCYYHGHCGGY